MVTYVITQGRQDDAFSRLVDSTKTLVDVTVLTLSGEVGDGKQILECIATSDQVIYWN